uniref:Major capsid protein N-terminal domain-containing protein n=1 Tax=viral metagenome TaxID=1070528 RepID=A0A6C0JJJ6_9ZZZZ
MAGGLMQLVAYGAQDVFLTGTPEITFWKVSYRRHTNFAMESIEQTFSGQADFGRRVTCTISRNGDLCYRTYLQLTLPEINQSMAGNKGYVYARWLNYIGEQIIAQVEVEIGGQRIDRQYGDWMHIWNQVTMSSEQQRGYWKMIGNTTQLTYMIDPGFAAVSGPCAASGGPSQVCAPRNALPETTLYIPLLFWFSRNPGLALPLIALQYHEVKINIDFRPIGECLWAVGDLTKTTGTQSVSQAYQQSLVAASLYVDYIFLDTDERRKMAQNPHEYLIEQLQFTGDESVGSSSNKIKLNFNHPCKELIWVVQPDANVDYCSSLDAAGLLFRTLGAQPFNYTDAIDALPPSIAAFGGPNEVINVDGDKGGFINASGLFELPGAIDGQNRDNSEWLTGPGAEATNYLPFGNQAKADNQLGSLVSDAGTFVLAETALDMHCWGENPCVTAKLQLNGQDRFSEREGSYFDVVQPFQHHTRAPDTGINVYSFALRPEEHQPSGSCNFSRIDNAVLQLVLSAGTVAGTATAKVRVYAVNYNVLRVMSGINRKNQLCQKTIRRKQTGPVCGNFVCAPVNTKPIVSGVTRM